MLLDARYEKVREEASVRSRAVQIPIGIDGAGRRQVLAAEVANRESEGSWTEFLSHLKERGLRGVEYVVSDSHEGLKHAISKVLPTALWQRCYVHFLRNARDKLSRSADPACLEGLKRSWGCSNSPYSFILGLMSVFSCFGTGNRRFQMVCTACRRALERVPGIDMQVS